MNDQIKAQILSWMQSIGASIKQGADFVAQQTPLVVQEKLLYERITTTSFVVFWLACIAFWIWLLKWAKRSAVAERPAGNWSENQGVPVAIVTFVLFIISIGALIDLDQLVMVWFAPRLFILQWIMNGLK